MGRQWVRGPPVGQSSVVGTTVGRWLLLRSTQTQVPGSVVHNLPRRFKIPQEIQKKCDMDLSERMAQPL